MEPVRFPVSLPRELHDWIRESAFRERRSMADLVREAVEQYRHRREPQLDLPIQRSE